MNPTRVLIAFAALSLASLVLLVVLPLRQATDALTQEGLNRVDTAAATNTDLVSLQMSGLADRLRDLSGRPELRQEVVAFEQADHSARTVLRELRALNPNIRSAFVASTDSRFLVLEPATRRIAPSNGPPADYFAAALASPEPVVSGVVTSRAADQAKVFVVAMAVRDPATGEAVGVFGATVDLGVSWQRYVDEFQRRHGVNLTLFDNRGIAAATPGGVAAGRPQDERVNRSKSAGGFSTIETVDGHRTVTAFRVDPVSGWGMMATADADAILAPVDDLERSTLVTASLLGLILLGGVVTMYRVLVGQRRTRSSLASVERKNQQILETAAQAYVEVTVDGTVTGWNRRAEQLFGWHREEILGRKWQGTLVAEEDAGPAVPVIDELVNDNPDLTKSITFELQMLDRDGVHRRPVEVTSWALRSDDGLRLATFVTDITERKRLEEEQALVVERQNRLVEELREADRVKSDFISTVSHELRTPLTSIVGYLEMFTDGYAGSVTEKQASMLSVIDRNSRRLLGLIEDILTLTRIESGHYSLSLAPVSVKELISGVELAMLPAASEKGINFETRLSERDASVVGDYEQLERMLFNLTSNAIKFTPSGGRVSVDVDTFEDKVRLVVSDTGMGIPQAEQQHLFTRFFRSTLASEAAIQGTGLGLTIVKSIVERHHGTIEVQSVEGEGTTFTVHLPLEYAGATSAGLARH